MADVIGLISGVFTLAQAVAGGLGLVMELYRAPEEIKTLQVGRGPSKTLFSMPIFGDLANAAVGTGPDLSTGSPSCRSNNRGPGR